MAHCADHMEGVQSFQRWDTIQKAGIKFLAQIFELKPTLCSPAPKDIAAILILSICPSDITFNFSRYLLFLKMKHFQPTLCFIDFLLHENAF